MKKRNNEKGEKGEWVYASSVSAHLVPDLISAWEKDGKTHKFRLCDPKSVNSIDGEALAARGDVGIERFVPHGSDPAPGN